MKGVLLLFYSTIMTHYSTVKETFHIHKPGEPITSTKMFDV